MLPEIGGAILLPLEGTLSGKISSGGEVLSGTYKFTADYTRKRDLFLDCLDDAGLTYTKPQGAYYVMVDCSEFGVTEDNQFCRWMAKEVGVAAVPGSSSFHEPVHHLIRLHFSRTEEIQAEAGRRLKKLKSLI